MVIKKGHFGLMRYLRDLVFFVGSIYFTISNMFGISVVIGGFQIWVVLYVAIIPTKEEIEAEVDRLSELLKIPQGN